MATIITVHGTFAHAEQPIAEGAPPVSPQWWELQSPFAMDARDLVQAREGEVEVKHFIWSGNNSEADRRSAGHELAKEFKALEARNEPYCVVGHSHGGSVVSAALLESAARKQPLNNLKRWVTIGTPFVNLRKEKWLLTRLTLMRKIIFVASMMLLMMFLTYLLLSQFYGERLLFGRTFPRVLLVTGIMSSLPALVIYFVLKWLDGRGLLAYRTRVTDRAKNFFGPRWVSLAHPDDEAIQGLAVLPDAKLYFFDKSFAVSAMTLISVITLPVIYLLILFSPPSMVGLAGWLKTEIYDARSTPEAEQALSALREELVTARRSDNDGSVSESEPMTKAPPTDRRIAWKTYRDKRRALEQQYPNLDAIERGLRFKQRFFMNHGEPCPGGTLCGEGRDLSINSALLLHVVTDELSWALGAADLEDRRQMWFWSLAVPAIVVPLIFGLVALVLMVIIQALAKGVSSLASGLLNQITNTEVKRSAYGNDTEGEVATGAGDRPTWLDVSQPRLPPPIAKLISDFSNDAAGKSIAKFRHAIGQIATAEPKHTADTAISTYFTWKELVHGSYFDVPEFRKLVAQAISRADGFVPSPKFKADPDFARTSDWLSKIETAPGTTQSVADQGAGPGDGKAVSAVLSSTVKASP